jgi:protein-S-isoprenylcysteine O-methyltransferase Ste14
VHQPGARVFKLRGWFGWLFLVPTVAVVMFSPPLIREGTTADLLADIVGFAIFACGGMLRLWSTLYVGAQKSRAVISEGPYSICRNPLYLGSFLIAMSMAIYLKSITVIAGTMLMALAYAALTIPAEERFLAEKFGEVYRGYRKRTPRLIPRFRLFHSPEVIPVNVRALRTEMWRLSYWILLPMVAEILAHLRAHSLWPHYFRLP